jgi:hypothetical protein
MTLKVAAPTWVLGAWFASVAGIVAGSIGLDATASTSLLLLMIGMAPAVVILFLRAGAPPPTVAEILHAANAKD